MTLAREWFRQDQARHRVRRFVAIDGPNQGIINCSPSAANYWQAPAAGGFTPHSAVCQELGSPNTPFLKLLNGARADDAECDREDRWRARHGATRTLVIRNADKSFVFFPLQDGVIAPVPAEDAFGRATDFSRSAAIRGAEQLDLVGQGIHDPFLGTGHLDILNSPQSRRATFEFLAARPGAALKRGPGGGGAPVRCRSACAAAAPPLRRGRRRSRAARCPRPPRRPCARSGR